MSAYCEPSWSHVCLLEFVSFSMMMRLDLIVTSYISASVSNVDAHTDCILMFVACVTEPYPCMRSRGRQWRCQRVLSCVLSRTSGSFCPHPPPRAEADERLSCLVLSCLVFSSLLFSSLVFSCLVLSSLLLSSLLLSRLFALFPGSGSSVEPLPSRPIEHSSVHCISSLVVHTHMTGGRLYVI